MLADTETKYDFSDWEVAEEEYHYTYDISRDLTEEEIGELMWGIQNFLPNHRYLTNGVDVWEIEGEPLKDGDIMTFTISLSLCTPSRVVMTR